MVSVRLVGVVQAEVANRGRGRGSGGRGSTPIGQIQSGTHTQARVFTVTQQ